MSANTDLISSSKRRLARWTGIVALAFGFFAAPSLSWGAVPTLARSFTFTTFDVTFFGTVNTDANAIDIFGQVVGDSADAKFSRAGFHAYLRDPDGSLTLIDVPFASATLAADINVQGVIVGSYLNAAGQHCFVLDGGEFTTMDVPLDVFPNAFGTRCRGINEIGEIVGTYNLPNAPNANHGFLLSRDRRTFTPIEFPGAVNTLVRRINNRGQIIGWYDKSSGGPHHGFVLHRGEFRAIDVPDAKETRAIGISNNGQIVGDYVDSDNNIQAYSLTHSTFTTVAIPGVIQNTGGFFLSTLLDDTGIYAVNDKGEITGVFLGDDGHFHGFIGFPTPF
jgi:uncharacterized membrane protein